MPEPASFLRKDIQLEISNLHSFTNCLPFASFFFLFLWNKLNILFLMFSGENARKQFFEELIKIKNLLRDFSIIINLI